MAKAGFSNPCDRNGSAIKCERCPKRASHRREVPSEHVRDLPGYVWLMSVNGMPIIPFPRSRYEVLCDECIKNWSYGPSRFS